MGTVDDHSVVAGFDLRPSILGLVGQTAVSGDSDGEDLHALMLGQNRDQPHKSRSKPLMWLRPPDRPGPAANPWPDLSIRDGDWKLLTRFDGAEPQLYDLIHDPNETTNLANKNPRVVDRLKKMVLMWYAGLPHDPALPVKAEANPPYLEWDDG